MNQSSGNRLIRPQWLAGPLAAWLDPFAAWMSMKGYARRSILNRIRLVSSFSKWLGHKAISLADIDPDHQAQYLRHRWQRLRPDPSDRFALQQFTAFLQHKGVLSFAAASAGPMTDAELCVQGYENYLRHQCGLAPGTVANYRPFVLNFLQHRFASGSVTLSRLSASDMIEFVQHQVPKLSPGRAKIMTAALRSFLRYACHLGEVVPELVAAVPAVAHWKQLNIPRGIGTDQVQQILASIDRSSATGWRDYAILMLLSRLGLRSGEIRKLELDDIDWNNATLRVRTKGGKCRTFPLSQAVGDALADYLRHERPECADRRVFLRARSPIEGFCNSSSIINITRRLIECAGVDTPTFGAHQFRHGLATEMLRQGCSLREIGDVLGHCHPDTTRIYAKVDLEALRSLVIPWHGGVR